jgi:hypothetical protein
MINQRQRNGLSRYGFQPVTTINGTIVGTKQMIVVQGVRLLVTAYEVIHMGVVGVWGAAAVTNGSLPGRPPLPRFMTWACQSQTGQVSRRAVPMKSAGATSWIGTKYCESFTSLTLWHNHHHNQTWATTWAPGTTGPVAKTNTTLRTGTASWGNFAPSVLLMQVAIVPASPTSGSGHGRHCPSVAPSTPTTGDL